MTSFVFPTLTGLTFDVVRYPIWNTEVQKALSGKRSTIGYSTWPDIHFELTFSILRDDVAVSDVKALVGLFNACQGKYDTFLFSDPDFSSVITMYFGTGDGVTTQFQLQAAYANSGGPFGQDLIQNLNGTPTIFVNGTLQVVGVAYTLGATGIITFLGGHIPAAAAVLTWTGSFYYRCAFDDDKLDLTKFMNKWWQIKKLPFTSIKL